MYASSGTAPQAPSLTEECVCEVELRSNSLENLVLGLAGTRHQDCILHYSSLGKGSGRGSAGQQGTTTGVILAVTVRG